ncbi:NfeD family protein [Neisseriaceae bacterium ESL0693]|nr:NfeD family protein [Neisseriaceae bacterium ESL0693]
MYWIIAAVVLFIIEMFTGTFYLLIISASLASAGLSAWLFQTSQNTNALIAILCSIAGILFMRFWLKKRQPSPSAELFTQAIDDGQPVVLYKPLADNLWQVQYRGTVWQACLQDAKEAKPGSIAYITGQKGNVLFISLNPDTTLENIKNV